MTDAMTTREVVNWLQRASADEMEREAADIITTLSSERDLLRERVEKVRDGYLSQMKFCDIEAMGYFREFVRRIDAALTGVTGGSAKPNKTS